MKYTVQQLIRATVRDLIADYRAAVDFGAWDCANVTHATLSRIYRNRHRAQIGTYGWPEIDGRAL